MGTFTQNTARQSHAASRPPASRPMNIPAIPAIWLMPSAMPRWLAGNASVRIAAELAISIDPPTACTNRQAMSHSAPGAPAERVQRQRDGGQREDGETHVVDPDPAEHVAQPAERDHEHRGDQQVPHDHPQQVADVPWCEGVQVDAAEDRGHGDDHDGGVERRHQHAERGVGQRHPAIASRLVGSPTIESYRVASH